jgi:hypothetical protein
MSDLHLADYARLLDAKFPAGVSADPTENMSPEDKAKWEAMNDEHGAKFKTADGQVRMKTAGYTHYWALLIRAAEGVPSEMMMPRALVAEAREQAAYFKALEPQALEFVKLYPGGGSHRSRGERVRFDVSQPSYSYQIGPRSDFGKHLSGWLYETSKLADVLVSTGNRRLATQVSKLEGTVTKTLAQAEKADDTYSNHWGGYKGSTTTAYKASARYAKYGSKLTEGILALNRLLTALEVPGTTLNYGFTDQEWGAVLSAAKQIVSKAMSDGISIKGGDGSGSPKFGSEYIDLNGDGDLDEDYETFYLTKDASKLRRPGSFCKTQHRPYDAVVVSILAAAQKIAPLAIEASSDGGDSAIKRVYAHEETPMPFTAGEESDTDAKFEKGKPADPTKNMSPADKAKWEKEKDDHAGQFTASDGEFQRYRTTWARQAAGSGSSNAKYLASLSSQAKGKILKHVAKHYGVSVSEIEDELTDRDAEDLFEYTATDRAMTMDIYNDFKRMRLASGKTAAGGLYGFTKAVQRDVEASVRKLQKAATTTAKVAWKKDPRIAAFLAIHAKRSNSAPARLLLAALKSVGPKVASQSRLALNEKQAELYDGVLAIAEYDNTARQAKDTGLAIKAALNLLRTADPEIARADFRAINAMLERDLTARWDDRVAYRPAPADLAAAKALVMTYVRRGRPFSFQDVYMDDADLADLDLYQAVSDLISEGVISGPDPLDRSTRGNHGDWVYGKSASGLIESPTYKEAKAPSFGMYGHQSRTARLGLDACSDIREAAGRIAYSLHTRRAAKYARITGFLQQHSKAARCRYSRLLLSSYPDAPLAPKKAEDTTPAKTASMPSGVDEWISWE